MLGLAAFLGKPETVEEGSPLDLDLQSLWAAARDPLNQDFGNLLLTADSTRVMEEFMFSPPSDQTQNKRKRERRDAGAVDRERRVADPSLDKATQKIKMFFPAESEHNLDCLPDCALATKPVTALVPIVAAADVSEYLVLNNPELKLALINR